LRKKQNYLYIPIGYGGHGGESVSQSPLKDQAFSIFLCQTHHLSYGRKMGFRLLAARSQLDASARLAVVFRRSLSGLNGEADVANFSLPRRSSAGSPPFSPPDTVFPISPSILKAGISSNGVSNASRSAEASDVTYCPVGDCPEAIAERLQEAGVVPDCLRSALMPGEMERRLNDPITVALERTHRGRAEYFQRLACLHLLRGPSALEPGRT
jgi:hypothetical protein